MNGAVSRGGQKVAALRIGRETDLVDLLLVDRVRVYVLPATEVLAGDIFRPDLVDLDLAFLTAGHQQAVSVAADALDLLLALVRVDRDAESVQLLPL